VLARIDWAALLESHEAMAIPWAAGMPEPNRRWRGHRDMAQWCGVEKNNMTDVQQFVAYDAGLDDELQDRLPSHNAPRFQSGLNAVIERRETLMNSLI